jgi:hypothetical protein
MFVNWKRMRSVEGVLNHGYERRQTLSLHNYVAEEASQEARGGSGQCDSLKQAKLQGPGKVLRRRHCDSHHRQKFSVIFHRFAIVVSIARRQAGRTPPLRHYLPKERKRNNVDCIDDGM